MFDGPRQVNCIICGKMGGWDCTLALTSDPPIEIEHMCPTCIKAVDDARQQKKYLNKLK